MSRAIVSLTLAAAALLTALGYAMTGPYAAIYRPGPVFAGHQRFSAACQACHELWKKPDPGKCAYCHVNITAYNSHSAEKLAAPLRAEPPPEYATLTCVNCHREHKGDETGGARYTGKPGLCQDCHKKDGLRFDHQEYKPESCQKPACHTYHFNITRTMFGDSAKARLLEVTVQPGKMTPSAVEPAKPAELNAMHDSTFYRSNPALAAKYAMGKHNGTAATCAKCHGKPGGGMTEKPPFKVCSECHVSESYGYSAGRHGAAPFRDAPRFPNPKQNVGCGSCHDVHSLILSQARKEACRNCHASRHVMNYEKSGHYRYLSDPVFNLKPVTGVDCAGCHMPKMDNLGGHTMHNESHTIKPLVMAQVVCARCHGMKFSLENLMDPKVIEYNFTYVTAGPIPAGLADHFRVANLE